MDTAVGPAWTAAYYENVDASALQSLESWQVLVIPKPPLLGLQRNGRWDYLTMVGNPSKRRSL